MVPIDLIFDGRVYRDGLDAAPSEFYSLLQKSKKLPTTSAPSPGEILQVYRKLSEEVTRIIFITLSSKLSMTFDRRGRQNCWLRRRLLRLP